MVELHVRRIHAAGAVCPRAAEELRLFLAQQRRAGPAERRIEAADGVDQRAADRHVGAEGHTPALLEDERVGSVIENRDGPPQIAARPIEPARTRRLPHRVHGPAGVIDRRISKHGSNRRLQPSRLDDHVVVREEDERRAVGGQAQIERVRFSLAGLVEVPQRDGKRVLHCTNGVRGVVGGVVVHDEDLPAQAGGHAHAGQTVERRAQGRGPVIRADQDGGGRRGRRAGVHASVDPDPSNNRACQGRCGRGR